MTDTTPSDPPDLTGSVDERIARLALLEAGPEPLTAEWLRRQLGAALAAWADDETVIDQQTESHVDY